MCQECQYHDGAKVHTISTKMSIMAERIDTILTLLGYDEDEPRWVGKCMDCRHWNAFDHKTGGCLSLNKRIEGEDPDSHWVETLRYFGCIAFEEKK